MMNAGAFQLRPGVQCNVRIANSTEPLRGSLLLHKARSKLRSLTERREATSMRFTEVATRLTGFSSPIFGVSWTPSEAEVTAAKRVITFLEDRRVLYNPTALEIPAHCTMSVIEIRRFLTEELGKLDPHEDLAKNLQAMRSACRKFLDAVEEEDPRHGFLAGPVGFRWSLGSWVFLSALWELRGVIGIHLAHIAVRNGLDIERDLASILPAEFDDDMP